MPTVSVLRLAGRTGAGVLLAAWLTAPGLSAQACEGNDFPDSGGWADLHLLGEGSGTAMGVGATLDPEGPWTIGASVDRWSLDRGGVGAWGAAVNATFEARWRFLSICPSLGLGHLDLDTPPDGPPLFASMTSLPMRVAAGSAVRFENGFRLIPFVSAEFGIDWTFARSVVPDVGMVTIRDSASGTALLAGAAVGYGRFLISTRLGNSRADGVGRRWAAALRIAL